MKACFAFASGTRSCGRRGPASEGSTSARSSSTTCVYVGWSSGSCQSMFSLQYASTRAMRSSERPVRRRYVSVTSSTGKKPQVAPYSGLMFLSVARSASASVGTPGPKYSTNFPTTPSLRRIWVTVRTRSVAADPPAEHAEPVDHRRVRVRADERVGERNAVTRLDDAREELEVDLMAYAGV